LNAQGRMIAKRESKEIKSFPMHLLLVSHPSDFDNLMHEISEKMVSFARFHGMTSIGWRKLLVVHDSPTRETDFCQIRRSIELEMWASTPSRYKTPRIL
jgi:hypothetical protein